MRGLVFLGDRMLELRSFPDPTPDVGEVVIAVGASGMCGSDLHYYRADPPSPTDADHLCIAGHEPAGTVVAVGPGVAPSTAAVGDRVMVHHYAGCGTCRSCRSGWTQMCTRQIARVYGKNDHGAHAQFMKVAAGSVMPLHEELSFEAAAAIGCGTGTAWGALERLGEIGGQDVVVFGQGPVGQSVTMLADARGARVIAVDPSADRRRQALHLGAVEVVDPSAGDPAAQVRELTAGVGARAAVDTSGAGSAADAALASLAPWGSLCAVGLGGIVAIDVRQQLSRQLTVMTSWSLSSVQQIACADFVVRRGLPVDALFTDRWSLDQAAEAYELFDKQASGKGAFVF
jgi:D-arabinose 1-dehydrogenase-like Zn-dependent alcohol dehydrogenase